MAASQYMPVVFMHGLDGSHADGAALKQFLRKVHPGQRVELLTLNVKALSYESLLTQLPKLTAMLTGLQNNFSCSGNGSYHLVAHSQGALLSRAALEAMSDHRVLSFISLAGPQAGIFGIPGTSTWPAWFRRLSSDGAYAALYAKPIQETVSFANYWHDPRALSEYHTRNLFLPLYNNEVAHARSAAFKANFLRTRRAFFLGGPDDGTIIPWQSTYLSYYRDANQSTVNTTACCPSMHDTDLYARDTFGLRSMDEAGRLHRMMVPGVRHGDFPSDAKVLAAIEPFLL
jgi:palmitoyl-protein thioesterase